MSAVVNLKPREQEAATIETITPAKAKQYLATMVRNRTLSDAKVMEYALAIDSGAWSVNGETVKFDEAGHLFDGQHRLEACVLADKAFRTYVVRGVKDARAMATVDTGKTRTHTDVWTMAGHHNGALASSAANILYMYEKGRCTWKGVSGRRMSRSTTVGQKLKSMPMAASNLRKEELLAYAEPIMEKLQESVRFAISCRAKAIVPPAAVAALHFLGVKRGFRSATETFLNDLGEGAGLCAGDPALTLREHINLRSRSGVRLNRYYVFGVLIKALNARLDGRQMKVVKVQADEEFPRVK